MTVSAPIRLMLVDDAVAVRRVLGEYLEGTGEFTIVGEAGDGERAIDLAREVQPDLVLLDIAMPVMDGLRALPLIRAASPGSEVVMFSAFEARSNVDDATRHGAWGYIEKGTAPGEIATLLRAAASGSNAS